MFLPRRKWLFTVHLASGHRHRFVANDLVRRTNGNELEGLAAKGNGDAWDYMRLDRIDLITSRRCWLRWSWSRP